MGEVRDSVPQSLYPERREAKQFCVEFRTQFQFGIDVCCVQFSWIEAEDESRLLTNRISEAKAEVKRAAEEAGFDLAGIAPARGVPEISHFPAWMERGHAGDMSYLESRNERGELKRSASRKSRPLGPQRDRLRHQLQHRSALFDEVSRPFARMDLALCLEPDGLPRGRAQKTPPTRIESRRVRRNLGRRLGPVTTVLCRYRSDRRTRLCLVRRRRLDRQEHLHPQPEKGLVALPRRHADVARTQPRFPPRSLRNLHPLHRCLPN